MGKDRKTIFNGLDISGFYKAREILREKKKYRRCIKPKEEEISKE